MAIDTRNKRASVIQFTQPAMPLFPNPDGTLDQSDRQQIALSYAGIAAAAPASGGLIYPFPLDGLGSLMRGGGME